MFYLSFKPHSILIGNSENLSRCLEISYNSCTISESQQKFDLQNSRSFYSLLGMKIIYNQAFLIVSQDIYALSPIGAHSINEIKGVSWIAVAPLQHQQRLIQQRQKQISQIQNLFSEGFHYYSLSYDLSKPYSLNKLERPTLDQVDYYKQFVWNSNIAQLDPSANPFYLEEGTFNQKRYHYESSIFRNWCCPVIQGYFEQFSCQIPGGDKVKYFLISRRSHCKAGTRFYSRGVDDAGNVANFTETEQLLFFRDFIVSHLQVRGSVPVFFEQLGVNGLASELNIERSSPLTRRAFSTHFNALQKNYHRILCINLLDDQKTEQKTLTSFFEQMISSQEKSEACLRYQYYDFHRECSGNNFSNVKNLIEKLKQVLQAFNVTCYDLKTKQFLSRQSGVIRTNCLDCLDRTNYVQSRVALALLEHVLTCLNDPAGRQALEEANTFTKAEPGSFLQNFNGLWADNGDSISLLYTGIGSTHTDITRTGKRTLAGTVNHKFRSLMRFYTQFTDLPKHQAINNFVGNNSLGPHMNIHSHSSHFQDSLLLSLKVQNDSFINTKTFLNIITQSRKTLIVLFIYQQREGKWFDFFQTRKSSPVLENWAKNFKDQIKQAGYESICEISNNNSFLGVFGQAKILGEVSKLRKQILSLGPGGEQVLLIKFGFRGSSLIFSGVNCNSYSSFIQILDEIHEKSFQIERLGKCRSSSMLQQNYRLILGNIGSQINLNGNQLQEAKRQFQKLKKKGESSGKVLSTILDHDDYGGQKQVWLQRSKYLRNYSQGPVQFFPTGNRLLFWNQQSLIVKVKDYRQVALSPSCAGIMGEFSYQIRIKSD